ncbi:MAG: TfoX/Sxy family protein [Pseudomonadota bacterium]
MALSPEFRDHVRDLFSGVGPVEIKRMFGGAGVYVGDACFALLVDEVIFMRGDDALGPDYEAAGGEQWVYDGKAKPIAMPYWRLPDDAMDDWEEAALWARRSLVPAENAAAEKRAAKARKAARAKSKPKTKT